VTTNALTKKFRQDGISYFATYFVENQ